MRETPPLNRSLLCFTDGSFCSYRPSRGYVAERARGWSDLTKRLPQLPPSMVLLLEPYGDHGVVPEFWDVLQRFPSFAIVAAIPLDRVSVADLRRMRTEGVSEVLDLRLTHSPALLARVADNAFARPLKRRVEAKLSRYVSGDARVVIRGAAEAATCAENSEGLGKVLGVTASTVTKWCDALHLPSPRRLLLWLRLLLIAQLMEDAERSIAIAARAAGYATDRSFRRALQDVVELNPRELRRRGAFAELMDRFNGEIRQMRG